MREECRIYDLIVESYDLSCGAASDERMEDDALVGVD